METKTTSRYMNRRSFLRQSSILMATLCLGNRQLLAQPSDQTWPDGMELIIDFEIQGRGKKPYVAVWVEDWTGQSVRTLHLWMQQRHGEQYLSELRRWYRSARTGQSGGSRNLMRTVSGPTRRPGAYSVIWDGLDDQGQARGIGDYYICVESARENGPYHLVRGRVSLEATPFVTQFSGGAELGDVHVTYRQGS